MVAMLYLIGLRCVLWSGWSDCVLRSSSGVFMCVFTSAHCISSPSSPLSDSISLWYSPVQHNFTDAANKHFTGTRSGSAIISVFTFWQRCCLMWSEFLLNSATQSIYLWTNTLHSEFSRMFEANLLCGNSCPLKHFHNGERFWEESRQCSA